jgi:hypothetical protein
VIADGADKSSLIKAVMDVILAPRLPSASSAGPFKRQCQRVTSTAGMMTMAAGVLFGIAGILSRTACRPPLAAGKHKSRKPNWPDG